MFLVILSKKNNLKMSFFFSRKIVLETVQAMREMKTFYSSSFSENPQLFDRGQIK